VGGGNQPSECSQSAGKELAWRDLASATAFICLFLAASGSGCGLLSLLPDRGVSHDKPGGTRPQCPDSRSDRQQGEQKKRQPMTINDRGRNLAQAGRALHAPAEARRAFRDLAKSGGGEAAGVLARSTGRGPRSLKRRFPFPGLLLLSSEIWLFFVYCFAQGFAWSELNQLFFRNLDWFAGVGIDGGSGRFQFCVK